MTTRILSNDLLKASHDASGVLIIMSEEDGLTPRRKSAILAAANNLNNEMLKATEAETKVFGEIKSLVSKLRAEVRELKDNLEKFAW